MFYADVLSLQDLIAFNREPVGNNPTGDGYGY